MVIIKNDELYMTRKKLIEEISSISRGEFNLTPGTDMWSLAQVCHHLYLAESAFTSAIWYGLNRNEVTKTESKNFENVLDRTKKIKAPDMVIPSNEPFDVQQILNLLNESRNKLLSLISTINDQTILLERSVNHPIFGFLPLNQWIDLIYLHEQRHIEQIKEIKVLIGIIE